jgi:hypothetical protein
MLKNNQVLYSYFDIGKGIRDFDIDLSKITKPSRVHTITSTITQRLQISVHAKVDKNFGMHHFLGEEFGFGSIDYYRPDELFQEYSTLMGYSKGMSHYIITKVGNSIPTTVEPFETSFNVDGTTLANFSFTSSGNFDFYRAEFRASAPNKLAFTLYSPSAANYNSVKLPDFSKYLDGNQIDYNSINMEHFGLHQHDGFDEKKIIYKTYNSFLGLGLNSRAVERPF